MRGAILAGGAASRFHGEPKGLKTLGDERILDRVVDTVTAAVGAKPLLVANDDDAGSWVQDLFVAKDLRPHCGSLGGIYSVVARSPDPVLIVAWDMPFLTPELLRALIQGSEGYDVFVPESGGPARIEPLCGVYHPRCAEPIKQALDAEDFQITSFHAHVQVGTLPLAAVHQYGEPEQLFFNVNTPDDLVAAEEMWKRLSA